MSQTQVQLVGNVTTGGVFTGVVTTTSVNIGGGVVGINSTGISATGVSTFASLKSENTNISGVTTSSGGFVGALTGTATGLSGTPNITVGNVTLTNASSSGVITATSFSGDGSGLSGAGIGSTGSINTSGIVTASTIVANEFVGTGDKLIFSPTITEFIPSDGATGIEFNTNIILTFNQQIYAGVGSIFLRNSSGIGTIIEAIGIGSTSKITISNQTLTINPGADLPNNTDVYVVLPQGVITNAVGGGIATVSSYNFTTLNFTLNSINPSAGATNVGVSTNITLTFSGTPTRGTGTIQLKSGSATTGTLIESFNAASSDRISVSGSQWILDPTSNLGYSTSIHTIIPSTAIQNFIGLNTTGGTSHSFTTVALALGNSYEGGFLICQSGGTRWVVAPSSSEVARVWQSRNDSNTRAQQVSGCTGWFVPDIGQLQNPGYTCRTYWDSYASARYWSNTSFTPTGAPPGCYNACAVNFATGAASAHSVLSGGAINSPTYCVRSLRCVTY